MAPVGSLCHPGPIRFCPVVLMDAAYLFNKYAAPIGYDSWRHLRDLVDWVANNWGREDEGVWKVRRGRRHFV